MFFSGKDLPVLESYATPALKYGCPDEEGLTVAALCVNERNQSDYDEWNTTLLGPFGASFFTVNYCVRSEADAQHTTPVIIDGSYCVFSSICKGIRYKLYMCIHVHTKIHFHL